MKRRRSGLENGSDVRRSPPATRAAHAQKSRDLATAAASTVARAAFAARAIQAAEGRGVAPLPRGMRGSGIYRREENAVSLAPVPTRRAVKIGRQYWDSKTLRGLLRSNPGATNPLTRQPLPPRVLKKYGGSGAANPKAVAEAVEVAALAGRVLSVPPAQRAARAIRLGFTRARDAGGGPVHIKQLRYSTAVAIAEEASGPPVAIVVIRGAITRPDSGDENQTPIGFFRVVGHTLRFSLGHEAGMAEALPYRLAAKKAGYSIVEY